MLINILVPGQIAIRTCREKICSLDRTIIFG